MDRREVGELVRLRLEELGLTAADLARVSGVSYRSIISALAGDTAIRDRRASVERALRWQPGSLYHAYKHGERPQPAEGETVADIASEVTISRKDYEDLLRLADRLREQYGPPPDDHQEERGERGA